MKYLIIPLMLLAAGCSGKPLELLDQAIDKGEAVADDTLNAAADTIDTYCSLVPEDARFALREKVNARTAKGDIRVDCVE